MLMATAESHICSYVSLIIFLIVSFIHVRIWRFVVSLTDMLKFPRNSMIYFSCVGIRDRFAENVHNVVF
jgi:hypothetical protein